MRIQVILEPPALTLPLLELARVGERDRRFLPLRGEKKVAWNDLRALQQNITLCLKKSDSRRNQVSCETRVSSLMTKEAARKDARLLLEFLPKGD